MLFGFDTKKKKILTMLTLIMLMGTAFFTGAALATAPSSWANQPTYIGPGSAVTGAAYTVFIDESGATCARNGSSGKVDFRAADAGVVIQSAIDAAHVGMIYIKDGTYLITTTLDFTDVVQDSFTLSMAAGANITGSTDGTPVMDFTGADRVHVNGGYIYGPAVDSPSIGMLFARMDLHGAGRHIIENVMVEGYFTVACVYNLDSEETRFTGVTLYNSAPNGYSIKIVQQNLDAVVSPGKGIPFISSMTNLIITQSRLVQNSLTGSSAAVYIGAGDVRSIHISDSYIYSNTNAKIEFNNTFNGTPGALNGEYSITNVHSEGVSDAFMQFDGTSLNYLYMSGISDVGSANYAVHGVRGSLYYSNFEQPLYWGNAKSFNGGGSVVSSNINGFATVTVAASVFTSTVRVPSMSALVYANTIQGTIVITDGGVINNMLLGDRTFLSFARGNYLINTIVNGSITAQQTYQAIYTEGGAATDDLENIAAAVNGTLLIVRGAVDGKVVTITETGNIHLTTVTFELQTTSFIVLFYDQAGWYELARAVD